MLPAAVVKIAGFFLCIVGIILVPFLGFVDHAAFNKAIYEQICEPRQIAQEDCPQITTFIYSAEIGMIMTAGLYKV